MTVGALLRRDSRMASHTIMLSDPMRGREPRAIVRGDEAGTVSGDHSDINFIRQTLDAAKPVTAGDPGGVWDLADPAEFLVLLSPGWQRVLDKPLRSSLPAAFDGVDVPPADSRRDPLQRGRPDPHLTAGSSRPAKQGFRDS